MNRTIPKVSPKGFSELQTLAFEQPETFYLTPSATDLKTILETRYADKGIPIEELYEGTITLQADLTPLNSGENQTDQTDAENAVRLREAIPGITPADAADHCLWASINCFSLLQYTTRRWNHTNSNKAPCSTRDKRKIGEWIREHYLGYGSEMRQYNAAARLWWLTELADRAAQYSIADPRSILSEMADNVELYHQLLARPYIASNPRITAEIYDLARIPGNEYLYKRPYPNRMMRNLNLKAATTSLGALSDETLARVVEEAKPPKGPADT